MWSEKWYLKRNISWDAHLLNELLETDVPWDDAIVVLAGKLRKTVGFPEWTAHFSVWKTGKDSSEACAIAFQNCAVYSVFFPSDMLSHNKIAQFNWECIERFTRIPVTEVGHVLRYRMEKTTSIWQGQPGRQPTRVVLQLGSWTKI
jgi:hypothetical protein